MACGCGHEHHHFNKKDFEKAVKNFMDGLGAEIDLDEEYEKIKNKKSDLSRSQRDTVVALVEYKNEHLNCSTE